MVGTTHIPVLPNEVDVSSDRLAVAFLAEEN